MRGIVLKDRPASDTHKLRGFGERYRNKVTLYNRRRAADYKTVLNLGGNNMILLITAWIVGFVAGVFLMKFLFVTIAIKASLAYNTIIGHNIHEKYQQVNMIPDWVKTLADNNIYQRYSLEPLRIVKYPAFYRKGFKFFEESQYKYAISYEGNGKYTAYRKVRAGISGNKTKTVTEEKSEIKV